MSSTKIQLLEETVGRFYVTLDGKTNVAGMSPIGPSIVTVVVEQTAEAPVRASYYGPRRVTEKVYRSNVSVVIDGRYQWATPAKFLADSDGVADVEAWLRRYYLNVTPDPSFVAPVVVTEKVSELEGALIFGVEDHAEVVVADTDYDEALARAMSYTDEVGLSDGTDRPAATVVELDPFAPRCGLCGELVEAEGVTYCPSCERETFGRRTDDDSPTMDLAEWQALESDDVVDAMRGLSVRLVNPFGAVARIVTIR